MPANLAVLAVSQSVVIFTTAWVYAVVYKRHFLVTATCWLPSQSNLFSVLYFPMPAVAEVFDYKDRPHRELDTDLRGRRKFIWKYNFLNKDGCP